MTDHEQTGEFKNSPYLKATLEICGHIQEILNLQQRYKTDSVTNQALLDEVETKLIFAREESFAHKLPFKVVVPPGTRAVVSMNWKELVEVQEYVVHYLCDVTPIQTDFYNDVTERWLTVYGHEMSVVPVFPE